MARYWYVKDMVTIELVLTLQAKFSIKTTTVTLKNKSKHRWHDISISKT